MPVAASTHIYFGNAAMVVDGTGLLLTGADTANGIFVGISRSEADNSAGAASAMNAEVIPLANLKFVEFDAATPLAAWVGVLVFLSDEHTVALAATTTNDVTAGRCLKVTKTGASGKVLVDVTDRNPIVNAVDDALYLN